MVFPVLMPAAQRGNGATFAHRVDQDLTPDLLSTFEFSSDFVGVQLVSRRTFETE